MMSTSISIDVSADADQRSESSDEGKKSEKTEGSRGSDFPRDFCLLVKGGDRGRRPGVNNRGR